MLKNNQYKAFSKFLYNTTGITIKENKKNILGIKIEKVMNKNKLDCYDQLYDIISNSKNDKCYQEFIDTVTTNTTDFFREKQHYDFIKNNINTILKNSPNILRENEIRVWSAGCSAGQEAVTTAIVLKECLDEGIKIKILATDISSKVLTKASKGLYSAEECNNIPSYFLRKYFQEKINSYMVKDEIKDLITFRYYNLMDNYKFKKAFNLIFCRNVMIYFDLAVQQKLINKFYNHLMPGGLFLIGHSESLINKKHNFLYKAPSIYMKNTF